LKTKSIFNKFYSFGLSYLKRISFIFKLIINTKHLILNSNNNLKINLFYRNVVDFFKKFKFLNFKINILKFKNKFSYLKKNIFFFNQNKTTKNNKFLNNQIKSNHFKKISKSKFNLLLKRKLILKIRVFFSKMYYYFKTKFLVLNSFKSLFFFLFSFNRFKTLKKLKHSFFKSFKLLKKKQKLSKLFKFITLTDLVNVKFQQLIFNKFINNCLSYFLYFKSNLKKKYSVLKLKKLYRVVKSKKIKLNNINSGNNILLYSIFKSKLNLLSKFITNKFNSKFKKLNQNKFLIQYKLNNKFFFFFFTNSLNFNLVYK
jgi:hypothetical protein